MFSSFSAVAGSIPSGRHRGIVRSFFSFFSSSSASASSLSSSSAGIVDGFVGAIGRTPLIRLNKLSHETGCNILAKNPGGSVKDRTALFIITDAEQRGQLKPGGTVVEGTAGNTGIGLAHICRARGYQCVIFMPNTQSKEKIDLLKNLGADVRPVPAVPYADPANFNHQAMRYAQEHPNTVWGNQFDNVANRRGHYETTGPEIWAQTNGEVAGFTCSTGTGGTLAGVSQYLKQQNPNVKIWLVDPPGSTLYNFFTTGSHGQRTGSSVTEGIGQGRTTDNLSGAVVDRAIRVDDTVSIPMVFRLLDEEGIFVGASSALNVVAAQQMAKALGPGHTIVTILADSAIRYQSRLFSKKWLQSKNLYETLVPKYEHYLGE